IRVIWTRSMKDTARYLRSIALKEQSKVERKPQIRSEKVPLQTSRLLEFIVAGFPNINTTLAKRLLEKFGSLEAFFNASIDELRDVKGIGKKIAEEIKALITASYESSD
ncbi:hypothetical protein DRO91_10165, partial [Candidatus Heimdallarchaeota archaeon]